MSDGPTSAARTSVRPSDEVLWLVRWIDIPFNYVLDALRQYEPITTLEWQEPPPREWEWARTGGARRSQHPQRRTYFGREVKVRRANSEREYPQTVTLVSPRLLWRLIRAPQRVIVSLEMNMATLYAVLSKVRGTRRVVVLFEGDVSFLGATGTARAKVRLRRLIAMFADVFVSNSAAATSYLVNAVGVNPSRVVEGWWLAGFPERSTADGANEAVSRLAADGPVFLTAGQLIPRKGIDLLLDAVAAYSERHAACRLRIVGDGPEREQLELQAKRLGIWDRVEFVGSVPHARMAALLRSCDLFVFPTLHDLIGRVVVEALSVGTPVAVSRRSGAAGTLIQDGENGVVMDPHTAGSMVDALERATEPETYRRLVAGARASSEALTPDAAARTIARAIARARRA